MASPLLWISEMLCRVAGVETTPDTPHVADAAIPGDQIEALLLTEIAAADQPPGGVVLVHFTSILAPFPSRRDRLLAVLHSSAATACDGTQLRADWLSETLVLRFTDEGDAVTAIIAMARKLFGADFDPAKLPARALVLDAETPLFVDLWQQPAAQRLLADRIQAPGNDKTLAFEYRPIWRTDTEDLAALVCVPRMAGIDLTSDKLDLSLEQTAAIDAQTIDHVAAQLEAAAAAGRVIGFPIHQTTLADAACCERALAGFLALPKAVQAHAVVEVVAIGDECSRLQLKTALAPLKVAKAIWARFHISQCDFSDLSAAGISAVGTDIALSQRAEAELLPMLSEFADAANGQRLSTYAQGLATVSLKTAAQSAAFAMVSGEPVGDPLADDIGAYPLAFDALYGDLVA